MVLLRVVVRARETIGRHALLFESTRRFVECLLAILFARGEVPTESRLELGQQLAPPPQ